MRPQLRIPTAALCLLSLGLAPASGAPVVGRLASPAGTLPALTVYAWSLAGAKLHSVTTEVGQATFSVELPPGRYYVFATPLDPGAPAIYGAYTEFAACSHDAPRAGCTEHGLRILVVGRKPLSGIDLTDWYLDDTVTHELDTILDRPPAGAPGERELTAPKFSEYPALAFAGAHARTLVAGDEPLIERDRETLTAALASGVNFAGRTALVRIGCGESCETVAFVDIATGRVAYPQLLATLPPAPPCTAGGPLQFRRDSRLLTVTALSGTQRVTRYFAWDPESGALRLVASLASALEERCSAAR